jgi:YidC/Oxa1 family membrane protein insertase
MQEEMQKLQAEAKFNPLAGCLPMLLQMPIFIALFQVLRELAERTHGTVYSFYNIVPDLARTPSQAFDIGFGTFVPYLVLMVVFAGSTFVPMMIQQKGKDNPQRKQTLIMGGVMSAFMIFISWNFPTGVLLFWSASGLIGIAQTQTSMSIMRKRDAEAEAEIEEKPVEVDVVRKAKKPRQTKKSK